MPTVSQAERRVDASSIKVEVVRSGSGITARRPPVTVEASEPESSTTNTGQVYDPAAHVS